MPNTLGHTQPVMGDVTNYRAWHYYCASKGPAFRPASTPNGPRPFTQGR